MQTLRQATDGTESRRVDIRSERSAGIGSPADATPCQVSRGATRSALSRLSQETEGAPADAEAAQEALADLTAMVNQWKSTEHALAYLGIADTIPHRTEGEATLLEEVPQVSRRILDLGCGDGRLLNLLLLHCASATGVALDFSPPMLERLRERFRSDSRIRIVEHDLDRSLPELGDFDVIASSFAIHHLAHARKRELYSEIWSRLLPGGVFCNLEHVASPSDRVHRRFLDALGIASEDPSNKLLDVETQLQWLREIGFQDVDCFWKWRELALLVGKKASSLSSARS
jgi:tRNA (cmo5U34)-methyltransferase